SSYSTTAICSPSSQASPVSSSTSRSAQASSDSPGSAFPFGSVQSSYFDRWTSRISGRPPAPALVTMPPAARTVSAGDDVLPPCHRHRFEPRMDAERAEDAAAVVSDCFEAEVEFICDLLGRPPVLEQPQNLRLARGQVRVDECFGLFLDVGHLPEDPDHPVAIHKGDGADLDGDAVALTVEDDRRGL